MIKTKVPMEAIGQMLAEVMQVASDNGADSRSMPDEYVRPQLLEDRNYIGRSAVLSPEELEAVQK